MGDYEKNGIGYNFTPGGLRRVAERLDRTATLKWRKCEKCQWQSRPESANFICTVCGHKNQEKSK